VIPGITGDLPSFPVGPSLPAGRVIDVPSSQRNAAAGRRIEAAAAWDLLRCHIHFISAQVLGLHDHERDPQAGKAKDMSEARPSPPSAARCLALDAR
jgi:hypothetical protein